MQLGEKREEEQARRELLDVRDGLRVSWLLINALQLNLHRCRTRLGHHQRSPQRRPSTLHPFQSRAQQSSGARSRHWGATSSMRAVIEREQ